jgi:hypothetical protein
MPNTLVLPKAPRPFLPRTLLAADPLRPEVGLVYLYLAGGEGGFLFGELGQPLAHTGKEGVDRGSAHAADLRHLGGVQAGREQAEQLPEFPLRNVRAVHVLVLRRQILALWAGSLLSNYLEP